MRKLKASEVKAIREQKLREQGGRCALCQLPCTVAEAVLDHDHATGAVRGTLHRGCNSLLGKVENNAPRFGVGQSRLAAFCHGTAGYLQRHTTNITGLIHPTHKTDEEKRLARNAKARRARAKKKEDT